MQKLAALPLIFVVIFCVGCAKKVLKTWESSGGSRADATVDVAYIYNPQAEIPQTSEAQARDVAVEKCRFWGYTEAEPFGLSKKRCQQMHFQPFVGPVCLEMMVTQTFQCLGRGDSATPIENKPQTPRLVKP